MSADSHTVCPKCHSDLIDYTEHSGIIDFAAEERGYDRSVRENISYYVKAEDEKLVLVFDYDANCWDCGWHFEATLEKPIPGLI